MNYNSSGAEILQEIEEKIVFNPNYNDRQFKSQASHKVRAFVPYPYTNEKPYSYGTCQLKKVINHIYTIYKMEDASFSNLQSFWVKLEKSMKYFDAYITEEEKDKGFFKELANWEEKVFYNITEPYES